MIEVNKPPTRNVTVQMGFTRNMGNFESLRIDIGLEAPAQDDETAKQAFDRVYSFVENRLMEKFAETEAELRDAGLGE